MRKGVSSRVCRLSGRIVNCLGANLGRAPARSARTRLPAGSVLAVVVLPHGYAHREAPFIEQTMKPLQLTWGELLLAKEQHPWRRRLQTSGEKGNLNR